MSGSVSEGKPWMAEQIARLAPRSVLDVGAGRGTYSDLARDPEALWAAVEVWAPYVSQFDLPHKYDRVYACDARTFPWREQWDLVIFGDVLEHMTREDAMDLWQRARAASKWVLLSIPIIPWPGNEEGGNPFEEHLETWTDAECRDLPGVIDAQTGEMVGCYLAWGLL